MKKKELLTLDKPIYVGCTVLELGKLATYKFYHDFVKKKCENPILSFTDTYSSCFETEGNFYEIMLNNKEFFDSSNFPKDSIYFCNGNKKVPGKMKDEYGGKPIWVFIGTKSKMYSILEVNKCEKSVYKWNISNITFDEFMDVHSTEKVIRHIMKGIESFGHIIYTYESNKTSLPAFDDKRYILDDGIHTVAHGQKDIPKYNKVKISYYDWY